MPIWLVSATWTEDDAEVSERWETNAATAQDAVRQAATHMRFPPHHLEARLSARASTLQPGDVRRLTS